jgi:TonB family protein
MPAYVSLILLLVAQLAGMISSAAAQDSQPPSPTPQVQSAPNSDNNGATAAQPGVGPGHVGGLSGGAFRVGGDVKPPKALYTPDPLYSDEARKAQYQGTVVLWLVVDADGLPQLIRVQRSLGMGLDEAAIAAVKQWKFEPATKNGQPVRVMINVEVNFRLFQLLPNPESTRQPPSFPGVKSSKYPLIVRLSASKIRTDGTTKSLLYTSTIVDAGHEQEATISCTMGTPTCLSFQDGTYPARWIDGVSGLEILGVLGTNGKWEKTEYAIISSNKAAVKEPESK